MTYLEPAWHLCVFQTHVGGSVDTAAAHQGVLWTREKGEPILYIWGLGLRKVWGVMLLVGNSDFVFYLSGLP